ncbi:hypothetical protein [Streptomyces roseolus]|uniref:hypothetical protein n=1 Tax=Streptomyces roseolus TaxID=67358 RepID=UPI00167274B0|nr:hypothetical protein [Streptomyces roseolus]
MRTSRRTSRATSFAGHPSGTAPGAATWPSEAWIRYAPYAGPQSHGAAGFPAGVTPSKGFESSVEAAKASLAGAPAVGGGVRPRRLLRHPAARGGGDGEDGREGGEEDTAGTARGQGEVQGRKG